VHSVVQDVRFAIRLLRKAPGFSVPALAALALGIGAATAIFSVLDAALIRPLPFRDPGRLVVIWERNVAQKQDNIFPAAGNFLAWRAEARAFESLAAIHDVHINLTGGPNGHIEPEELAAERVSAELFPLLGVNPVLGRSFLPEEDRPGRTNCALLSYRLWQRRFGGDPSIPGKALRLRGESYTVTGVLPPGFSVLEPGVDIWIPLGLDPNDARTARGRFFSVIARLKPGAGIDRARAELNALGDRLEREHPDFDRGWRPAAVALRDEVQGELRRPLAVLAAAVGLLLLIACVNVANLLLARGAARRKEIAIRAALGASRGRLAAQLLAESVLLALAGGLLGLAVARAGIFLLARLAPAGMSRLLEAHLDGRALLFALCASAATGILFGMAPAIQVSGESVNAALSEGGRGGTIGRSGRRLRGGLVISEVALAVVVLIGAGLLMRSFVRLRAADPGFRAAGVLTFRMPLAGGRNAAPPRRAAFVREVIEGIAALPGVQAAGATNQIPLAGIGLMADSFAVAGRPLPPPGERPMALVRSVTPEYFRTMGIPLAAGRGFADSDTPEAPPVVIVNRTLARRFFPGGAVNARLLIGGTEVREAEIVGVAGDARAEHIEGADWPAIYTPWAQSPIGVPVVAVQTAGPAAALATAVEHVVHGLDREQPVADVRPMEDLVDQAVAPARFHAVLLGIFAEIAFLLAAVGIYGVISYDVNERTHEIGIRVALGAGRGDVLRLVLGQGARLAAGGIGTGLAAAFGLTRLMASMLYGVKPADAWTFGAMALLLGAVALAASWLPSRRAMGLDPVAALRHE
jgi:putative ABC transport system permease protein